MYSARRKQEAGCRAAVEQIQRAWGVVENYSTDKTSVPSGVEGPAAVAPGPTRLGGQAAAAAGEKGASSWGGVDSSTWLLVGTTIGWPARVLPWLCGERGHTSSCFAGATHFSGCNSAFEGRDTATA
jgi:hypothetical protein